MKKNKHISIRVNERQRKYIENQAQKYGNKKISEFVLKCIMNKAIIEIKDLKGVRYELNRIGNNLNQITKKVNQNTVKVISLRETKIELQQIWQLLNSLIIKVETLER